jgi:hypothetical protein
LFWKARRLAGFFILSSKNRGALMPFLAISLALVDMKLKINLQ